MTEEAKSDVVAEQTQLEGEAPAAPAEEKPKDTRSFEERLAELKKPDPVPNPDQDAVNDKLSKLNAQIEKCEKRLSEIKTALDKANMNRDKNRDESKHIVDQLKEIRAEMKEAMQEKEGCFQQLRDMTTSRQAQQKALHDIKRSLKYEDVAQVEARVKELEAKIEQGQCKDLKEEKQCMQEMKQLNQMKSVIHQYQSQRQTVTDDSDTKAELERRRGVAVARLDDCKKRAEKLEKALEAMRSKQTGNENVNELWKEQKELYAQIKTHRAEIRKVNGEFKEEVNKWRDYQRALNNYKKAQSRILGDQRRAEMEARKAQSDEPIDKDVPSDDPYLGHPWSDEIYQCVDLVKVLSTFLPTKKEEEAPKVVEEPKTLAMQGARLAGKNAANKDDDDMFAGLVSNKKKKGQSAKKGGDAGAVKKVVLSVDAIGALSTIGVQIPTTSEQLVAVIEEVKAKKTAFEGMTEEQKKAQKAKNKAQKEKNTPSGASSDDLVNVDISATSSDKVKVKIDYPALSASA